MKASIFILSVICLQQAQRFNNFPKHLYFLLLNSLCIKWQMPNDYQVLFHYYNVPPTILAFVLSTYRMHHTLYSKFLLLHVAVNIFPKHLYFLLLNPLCIKWQMPNDYQVLFHYYNVPPTILAFVLSTYRMHALHYTPNFSCCCCYCSYSTMVILTEHITLKLPGW